MKKRLHLKKQKTINPEVEQDVGQSMFEKIGKTFYFSILSPFTAILETVSVIIVIRIRVNFFFLLNFICVNKMYLLYFKLVCRSFDSYHHRKFAKTLRKKYHKNRSFND